MVCSFCVQFVNIYNRHFEQFVWTMNIYRVIFAGRYMKLHQMRNSWSMSFGYLVKNSKYIYCIAGKQHKTILSSSFFTNENYSKWKNSVNLSVTYFEPQFTFKVENNQTTRTIVKCIFLVEYKTQYHSFSHLMKNLMLSLYVIIIILWWPFKYR